MEGKKIGTLYMVGKVKDAKFWVRGLLQFTNQDRFTLSLGEFGSTSDSIKIAISEGEVSKLIDISTGQEINENVTSDLVRF